MFIARVLFFKLYESPRYLVNAGRQQDAVHALRKIAQYNGHTANIDLADVQDELVSESEGVAFLGRKDHPSTDESTLSPPRPRHPSRTASSTGLFDGPEVKGYESATHTPPTGAGSPPVSEPHQGILPVASVDDYDVPPARPRPARPTVQRQLSQRASMMASQSSYRGDSRMSNFLPAPARAPLDAWLERVYLVLAPEWRRTTILVWITWWAMSFGTSSVLGGDSDYLNNLLAFTMFNVYLPKLLESAGDVARPKTITESLWDIVIFTLGGCPGALVGQRELLHSQNQCR
jgi:hypothetical protein